jgi:hypothetical protein
MPAALARHDTLIGDAVHDHSGVLLKWKGEGDSTFSVFEQAVDAVGAAIAAQQALRLESWPAECPVAVRMALHSGEAVERDGDYFGRTVNRSARLRALAAGGEVLLSATTATLVAEALPAGVFLTGLGIQQLKDLDTPEIVYQLLDEGQLLARRPLSTPPSQLPLPHRVRATRQPALVGRTSELDRLAGAWARSLEAGTGVVVVEGAPGIGKSRLVSEFAARLHEQGAVVLAGHCAEMSRAPYQPFVEMVRFVLERTPPDGLGTPSTEHAALARLVPDLRPEPGPRLIADPETEREQLMMAVAAWTHRVARENELLIVIEDVHWATEGTAAMLRAVLPAIAEDSCLVLVTARPGSSVPLAEDSRQLGLHYDAIGLAGLTEAETIGLLEVAEPAIAPERAAEVHAFAGGNPLFAVAMAAAVATAGDRPVATLELPAGVHAMLDRQLDRLDGDTLAFLRAAAVLGVGFEVDLAADLIGASFAVVEDALDAGERHHVVRERSAGSLHTYEFTHSLLVAALVGQLSSIRRRRLNSTAARLVAGATNVVGDRLSRAAHHAELAGPALPAIDAIPIFRAAAADAGKRMAWADASHWLDVARGAAALLDDPRSVVELDVDYGAAALAAGVPGARTGLHHAAERAWELGDAELFADALTAGDMVGSGEFLRVDNVRIALLERALDTIRPDDLYRRTRLLVSLAEELVYVGDRGGRRFALADEALMLARRLDDPRLLDIVSDHRLRVFAGLTRVRQRLAETEERLGRLAVEEVPLWHQVQLLAAQCQVCEQLGRIDDGRAYLMQLHGLAAGGELVPRQMLGLELMSGGWALLSGELTEAEAAVRRARLLVESTGMHSLGLATARVLLGVRFWRDRAESMLGAVASGVSLFPAQVAHHAYWLLQVERVDEAAEMWARWEDDTVEDLLDAGDGSESFVVEAAGACAAFDGVARCRYYYSLLEPHADLLLNPFAPDQPTHHYLGLLAHAVGDIDGAIAHFEASRSHAERLDAPLMAARASLERARVLHLHDLDRQHAADLARDAVAVGRSHDAAWLVRNGTALLEKVTAS